MKESPKFSVDSAGMHIPTGNSEVVLSRRQLLIGAGVVAGVAAVGTGAAAFQRSRENSRAFDTLSVDEGQVATLDAYKETKASKAARLEGSYRLPYGSLIWCNSDSYAICLLPTSRAKPLATIALLSLATGTTTTLLGKAKNQSAGFEIYDARATDNGLIWTEANILTGAWKLYTAQIANGALSTVTQVDQGDSSTQTPTLVAADKRAYWQVLPAANNDDRTSVVKTTSFANPSDVQTIYTYERVLATDLALGEDGVVITPLHEGSRSCRQLTLIDATGKVLDSLTLPSAMVPQNVGYGPTGFTFTFSDIYNYGGGIAQLGTYAPVEKPADGNYSSVNWFRFGRTPLQAPAWCSNRLLVKSSSMVAGIDMANKQYFTFSLENGAEDYGDCLASEGSHKRVVTFQNVDNTEAQEVGATNANDEATYCLVRVWSMNG